MQLFYAENIREGKFVLDKTDSGHCIKVLRKKAGDEIHLADGKGMLFTAKIVDANHNKCKYEIITEQEGFGVREKYLHVAISPTKNINRFEWFLEKATEIGIEEITPILTYHSERKTIKEDRLNKILISAMKQSLKAKLPKLNPLMKWKSFLQEESWSTYDFKGIACMVEKSTSFKKQAFGQNTLVVIGPEGGFSDLEIEEAVAQNFTPVTLGESRLRTETAGIVVCSLFG